MTTTTAEVLLVMPRGAYAEVRAEEFELLARHVDQATGGALARRATTSELALRVALSNVFVSMARQGRVRS